LDFTSGIVATSANAIDMTDVSVGGDPVSFFFLFCFGVTNQKGADQIIQFIQKEARNTYDVYQCLYYHCFPFVRGQLLLDWYY